VQNEWGIQIPHVTKVVKLKVNVIVVPIDYGGILFSQSAKPFKNLQTGTCSWFLNGITRLNAAKKPANNYPSIRV
jgi:hypothetical protein